jgi:hypothetical protein
VKELESKTASEYIHLISILERHAALLLTMSGANLLPLTGTVLPSFLKSEAITSPPLSSRYPNASFFTGEGKESFVAFLDFLHRNLPENTA